MTYPITIQLYYTTYYNGEISGIIGRAEIGYFEATPFIKGMTHIITDIPQEETKQVEFIFSKGYEFPNRNIFAEARFSRTGWTNWVDVNNFLRTYELIQPTKEEFKKFCKHCKGLLDVLTI